MYHEEESHSVSSEDAGRDNTFIKIIITLSGSTGQEVVNPGEGEGGDVYGIVRVGGGPPQVAVPWVLGREVVVLRLTVNTVPGQGLQLLLAGGDVEDSDGLVRLSVHYFVSQTGVVVMTDAAEEWSLQSVCLLHGSSWSHSSGHLRTSSQTEPVPRLSPARHQHYPTPSSPRPPVR